jgi:ubiquinone/menaquinone biosynthesis C-methylase UbiE
MTKVSLSPLQQGIVNFLQSNETWMRPLLVEKMFDGVDVQAKGDALASKSLTYPDYYKQDFHSVEGGYLNKDAALTYDPITKRILLPSEDFLRDETAKAIPSAAKTILDLGCGTGTATRAIATAHPEAAVTGVDLSPYMIAAAELKAVHLANVKFIHANAEQLPFDDNSVDAVSASLLFHEMPTAAGHAVIREAYRVLKPGGALVIFDGAQSNSVAKVGGTISSSLFLEPYAEQFLATNLLDAITEVGFHDIKSDLLMLIYEIRSAVK